MLRNGVKDSGCKFRLAYFRPASGLNEELQRLHAANQFAVVRQLEYSEKGKQSLDLALFLNGVPIFTAELKSPLNNQDVQDAIRQYRKDRDPREPLFHYGRCLAHFAVDPELVFVTTHLRGTKTRFLPFNQGRFGGAGNPPVPPTREGFATGYLWERIWARDSVLDLVRQFIHEVRSPITRACTPSSLRSSRSRTWTSRSSTSSPAICAASSPPRARSFRARCSRSGPDTVPLGDADVEPYVRTRFPQRSGAPAAS